MRRIVCIIAIVLFLTQTPVFADSPNLNGFWAASEIFYKDVNFSTNIFNSSEITASAFPVSLEIREDNSCFLRLNNIIYSGSVYCNEKGKYSLTIADHNINLESDSDGVADIVLTENLIVVLKKSDEKPDYSGCLRIEDILSEEEKQEALRKKIAEAEAAALAARKPASVYDMNVFFSDMDTARMSAFMNYGRYYLDGNTMFGMAYDKSGFLPNLVKCEIVFDGDTPKQEVFTLVEKHVNANFLTAFEGQLYYVSVDRESGLSSLARVDLKSEQATHIGAEMHEMAYLQVHDGRLWYTGDGHRLYSCKLNGKDNRVELDKAVYDPYFLTDDWLIYQDEADGETLHIRCIKDETDLKITDKRSFSPIVDGTVLYFASIPDDGGKAYLSRIDLSKPVKEGELCFIIETSDMPMSKNIYIFNSVIYGENNSSVNVVNWRNLTNTAWLNITQRYFYIGDPYVIYGEIYSEHATVSVLYLVDKKTGLKSPFRHVY